MANNSHYYLRNELLTNETYSPSRRSFRPSQTEEEARDYTFQKQQFNGYLTDLIEEQQARHEARDQTLGIPTHIDYIEIKFFKPCDLDLEVFYLRNYGLTATQRYLYNQKVLFAITSSEHFQRFISQVQAFINDREGDFDNRLKLMEEFHFLSSNRIRDSFQEELSYLELISDGINPLDYRQLSELLTHFLTENGIQYHLDTRSNVIEVTDVDQAIIDLIIDNFDIVSKINSSFTTKIVPGEFGQDDRTFSFSIESNDNLPIIGVVDTGISNNTPLANLIVNNGNPDFDITGTSAEIDEAEHGTAVGALAALGNQLNLNPGQESYHADAKLLSIKVLQGSSGVLQRSKVVELIRKANSEHGVRIFTLTVTENHRPRNNNEEPSKYALLLDQLAYELDILIFISIGNYSNLYDPIEGSVNVSYPEQFDMEFSNMEFPAESYNNLTVGAIADNFEEDDHQGITPNKLFPAIYTRTNSFDKETCRLNRIQTNKGLFKPDIVLPGGDYDYNLDYGTNPGFNLMASKINNQGGFYKNIGTSFATPLAANLAAKIISIYPELNMQTVKALIINNSKNPWGTQKIPDDLINLSKSINDIIGHGMPNEESCLFSSDDEVTMIVEDSITMEYHKVIPIHIPDFLLNSSRRNVLEIKATLCYKFKPVSDNHLGYCPLHMSFGIFKNRAVNSQRAADINLKTTASWSEDYHYKTKLLCNVQKVRINISKVNIAEEENQFRIAIRSKPNKILPEYIQNQYQGEHPFSLVIKLKDLGASGNLYSELDAVNDLSAIIEAEAEADTYFS